MYEAKKICKRCNEEFVAFSHKAEYCPECRPSRRKETKRAYKKAHPSSSRPRTEKNLQYEAAYRRKNRERINENARASYRRRKLIVEKVPLEKNREVKPLETVTVEAAGTILTMYVCERMHLKATNLPCGDRYECWVKPYCEHIPEGKTPLAYGEQRTIHPWQQAQISGFINRTEG